MWRVPDPREELAAGPAVQIEAGDLTREHGGEPGPGPGSEWPVAAGAAGRRTAGELRLNAAAILKVELSPRPATHAGAHAKASC